MRSLLRSKFIVLNGAILILYLLSLFVEQQFKFLWPINLMGLLFLIFVTPYNITELLSIRLRSRIEQYFVYLVIFFFIYTPGYFFLNKFFHFKISEFNVLLVNLIISLVTFGSLLFRRTKWQGKEISFKWHWRAWLAENWLLVLLICFFIATHALNFYFYKFIPEWDGYTKLIEIDQTLETGLVSNTYRGFFTTAISIISIFSKITPYTLFALLMIVLQSSLVLVLYRFILLYGLKNRVLMTLLMLSAIAVPVINMEVDIIRPQSMVVIFLPMYIYFLYLMLKERSLLYGLLASLIAIMGLNHHELFIFIFASQAFWVFVVAFKRYYLQARDERDRLIFVLASLVVFLFFIVGASKVNFFLAASAFAVSLIDHVSEVSSWRWWFLSSYVGGDNVANGWPGLSGAIKYYGYYLSPVIALTLLLLTSFLFQERKKLKQDTLFQIALPLLTIFIIFAEILPRLNYALLPDRFWVLIDIIILLLAVPLAAMIKPFYLIGWFGRTLLLLYAVPVITGIAGSLYVAHGKGALTDRQEYQTAQWIKANTPSDAIFISQAANRPMVQYFAKRKMIFPEEGYFMSQELTDANLKKEEERIQQSISQEKVDLETTFGHFAQHDFRDWKLFSDYLQSSGSRISKLTNQLELNRENQKSHLYVLYSKRKFTSMYASRGWWQTSNFYGANLEKFNKHYKLIYDKDSILIWEVL